MTTFALTSPIKHGDDELVELELREPTAKDIRKLGFPFTVEKGIKADVVYDLVSTLSALPPSVIAQISAKDFVKLTALVVSFFTDSEE